MRNILITIGAAILGQLVAYIIIQIGPYIIPPPNGMDIYTHKGLYAAWPYVEPKHFFMPFFGHAMGSFMAATLISRFATRRILSKTLLIGLLYLFIGIYQANVIPSPWWFKASDVCIAYMPMTILGYYFGILFRPEKKA